MRQISRRQMAVYAAKAISAGQTGIVDQLAAYLSETGRKKEVDLLVRDIEKALQAQGIVVVRVKTAFGLEVDQRTKVERMIKQRYDAKRVVIAQSKDDNLLGGIVVNVAGEELDSSLRRNINRLRAVKV